MNSMLMWGEYEIGLLENANVDNFWCYGKFRRGKDFAILEERLRRLEQAYEANCEDSDEAAVLQAEIDALELSLVTNRKRTQLRGFKLHGDEYEYRLDLPAEN